MHSVYTLQYDIHDTKNYNRFEQAKDAMHMCVQFNSNTSAIKAECMPLHADTVIPSGPQGANARPSVNVNTSVEVTMVKNTNQL